MPSTYSNLKIQLMATGENATTWGDITNVNLGTALEEAIVGSADVTFASANVTLTLTDTNTSQTARNMRLRCIGTTGGSTRNLVVPAIEKPYIVQNDCADSVVVKTSAGAGVTVPAGKTMWVYSNGTDVVATTTHLTSLTLTTALPVASGGTGANTFTNNALLKGGGTSALVPSVMYENGGYVGINVSGPAFLLDAQETLNGSGGISYVNLSTGASSAGSITVEAGGSYFYHKVTRATGVVQFRGVTSTTLNQDFNTQVFRSTGGTEYARLDGSGLTLATALTVASGGTGGTTQSTARSGLGATTLGGNLFTITNPSAVTFPRFNADNTVSALDAATFRSAIGAGTSSTTGTVTNVTGTGTVNGITLTGSVSSTGNLTLGGTLSGVSLSTQVTGTLPIGNGGTNATTESGARTNLGATTVGGNMFTLTNPSAVTFPRFNADNTVSALDASTFRSAIGAGTGSGDGTVTSVAMSVPSFLSVSGSPVTSTGTLAVSYSGTALPVANGGSGATTLTGVLKGNGTSAFTAATAGTDYVAPGGALGTPSSGTLTNCTFPTLNQNTTGSAGSVTNAVTFNTSGGAAAGTTFNGSAARTIDYSTVGAYAATNPSGFTSNTGTVTSVATAGSTNGLSLTGGTFTTSGTITLSGSVTSVATGATIDGVTIGYRNIPRSTTSGTATTGDVGKVIAVSAGITIPNSTFAAGDAVSIYNDSASPITITAGVSTLRQAGTANTGNRTLAARGMATVWFNSATEAIISGAGVS